MKKLACFALVLALVTPAFAGFCGWEMPQRTRECSGGMFFECRTSCQSLMSSNGWSCICSSKCTYLGECTQVASTPDDKDSFKAFLKREAIREATPKKRKAKRIK